MHALWRRVQMHAVEVLLKQGLNRCAAEIVSSDLHGVQNKKYRCAIGKLAAGSQVSNWPSARTL
jgi:hypothetical protein